MTMQCMRAAIGAAVLTLVASAAAGPSYAAPHDGTRIAFSVPLPDGGTVTDTVAPDGTGLVQVPTPYLNEDFGRAVWSHDGRHLLYSNVPYVDPVTGEFVGFLPAISNADGSDYRLLFTRFTGSDSYCTAWSADDSRILCGIGWDAPGSYSFRADDGGDPRQLSSSPYGGQDNPVGVSPDGSRYAFFRFKPGHDNHGHHEDEQVALFVSAVDGSDLRQVTPYGLLRPGELTSGDWSPNGRDIASATSSGQLTVVHVDAGGSSPVPLHTGQPGGYLAFAPSYSPDGTQLVFSLKVRDQPADLYTASVTGADLTQITDTPDQPERFPDWGP